MSVAAKRSAAGIDAWRGLAALGVAVFHSRVWLWVGWRAIHAHPERYSGLDRASAWLAAPAPFLGSLVMLFFVISGFCVHLPQAERRPWAFGPYIRRRFLRIYPPYLAAVLISAGVSLGADGWSRFAVSVLMVQNYCGGQLSSNPSLWSLPVEMELYLAYPLFLFLLRRGGLGLGLAVTGLVSAAAVGGYLLGARWLPGNFAQYWILWCAGAYLAELWSRGAMPRPPVALGAAAVASLALSLFRDVRGQDAVLTHYSYGLFYFWLVWTALAPPGWWPTPMPAIERGLSWLGRVSYSYYLLHFPLFYVIGILWLGWTGTKPACVLVAFGSCILIAPFVGFFYRLIELPSHRWAKRSR